LAEGQRIAVLLDRLRGPAAGSRSDYCWQHGGSAHDLVLGRGLGGIGQDGRHRVTGECPRWRVQRLFRPGTPWSDTGRLRESAASPSSGHWTAKCDHPQLSGAGQAVR